MKKLGTTLIGLAASVAAYTNETKTTAYLKLTNNEPIQAFMQYHENAWGDWFYLIGLALGPFFGMYITQRNMHIPTIWLMACLAAYNWLIPGVPPFIFYLVAAVWVMSVLVRLLSPVFTR